MSAIDDLTNEFFADIGITDSAAILRYQVSTFQNSCEWPDWAQLPGVYFFEQDDRVMYVGRALRACLRDRVGNQCRAFGDPSWDAVIGSPRTTIGVVVFPKHRWHLVAALEAKLIADLRPPRSKRIS